MTLVDFETEVRVAKYGQNDFPRMVERIRVADAGGRNRDVRRAGCLPRRRVSDDEGRKILVLYTDGGDTQQHDRFGDVMTLVRASDVTVYSSASSSTSGAGSRRAARTAHADLPRRAADRRSSRRR